jgi:hypothetical protein
MAMSGPYSGFLGSAGYQASQDERILQMFLTSLPAKHIDNCRIGRSDATLARVGRMAARYS